MSRGEGNAAVAKKDRKLNKLFPKKLDQVMLYRGWSNYSGRGYFLRQSIRRNWTEEKGSWLVGLFRLQSKVEAKDVLLVGRRKG